jgi:hypothetical protein
MVKLGERLRAGREAERYGLREWAQRFTALGYPVAYQTVAAYERAEREIPAGYVAMVALVTNRSVDSFVFGEDRRPGVEGLPQRPRPPLRGRRAERPAAPRGRPPAP